MDGLDEAAGWQLDTSVLPPDPPPGIRIVASARQLAGDRGSSGWLRRLGWDARGRVAKTLELNPLSIDGVRDVLFNMGFPVRELSTDVDVVAELFRLTEHGDPLLLDLYASDLWRRGPGAPRLSPRDLKQMKPGFGDYFARWFDQQEKVWGEAGQRFDKREIEASLSVLSCVLGPIKFSDFTAILERLLPPGSLMSRQMMVPVGRFVIGDGVETGYAFSHPKLGHFMQEEYFAGSQSIQNTRRAIAEWGRAVVRDLNAGMLEPERAPEYALLYYIQHLEQLKPNVDFTFYTELVEDGWRKAWLAHEEGLRGFARDVQVVYSSLRRVVADHPDRLKNHYTGLGGIIRSALCLCSIRSVGAAVPPNFLAELVRQDLLSAKQALHLSRLKPEAEQAAALRALCPYLGKDLEEAIADARAISSSDVQGEALAELAMFTPQPRRGELLTEALEAAERCPVEYRRSSAKRNIEALGARDRPTFPFHSAEDTSSAAVEPPSSPATPSRSIGHVQVPANLERRFAEALQSGPLLHLEIGALAPFLPDDLLEQAVKAAAAADGFVRSRLYAELAPRLPDRLLGVALEDVLAERDENAYWRSGCIAALAPELQPAMVARALQGIEKWKDGYARQAGYRSLFPYLSTDQLEHVLELLTSTEPNAYALWSDLAQVLPLDSYPRLVQVLRSFADFSRKQALDRVAGKLSADRLRFLANALSGNLIEVDMLLPYLPEQDRMAIVRDAYKVGFQVGDGLALVALLLALAPRLGEEQALEAVEKSHAAALRISIEEERAFAIFLLCLAPTVPRDLQRELVVELQRLANNLQRQEMRILLRTASLLSPAITDEGRSSLMPSLYAQSTALESADMELTWLALCLTGKLSSDQHEKVVQRLISPQRPSDRGMGLMLAGLLPAVPREQGRTFVNQGLEELVGEDKLFASVLASLSPGIDRQQAAELASRALNEIGASPSADLESVLVPATLAPYLPVSRLQGVLSGMLDNLTRYTRAEVFAAFSIMEGAWLPLLGIHPALNSGAPPRSILETLGGTHAVAEVYRTVQDVMSWWP